MNDFWEMRKNLGEPKTSVDFEEIEEGKFFSIYWDKEHPSVVYQLGTSNDTDTNIQRHKDFHYDTSIQGTQDLGSTKHIAKLQMSDSTK